MMAGEMEWGREKEREGGERGGERCASEGESD